MPSNLSLDLHSPVKFQPHLGVMRSLPRNARTVTKAEREERSNLQPAEPQRGLTLVTFCCHSSGLQDCEGTSNCCQ